MVNNGADASVVPAQNEQNVQAVAPVQEKAEANNDVVNTSSNEAEPQKEQEEKLLKQSEVNKIVAREKKEAREKALLEMEQRALENVQRQQEQISSGQVSGDAPLTRNDLINSQQEIARLAQEEAAKNTFDYFKQRAEAFSKEDPAFTKEVLANLPAELAKNTAALHGLNSLENAKDVLREMANHPAKYADIDIAFKNNPQWGMQTLYRLAASIKANKEALSQIKAPAPLDQIKSSPTGTDNGKRTVAEMRKDPFYRV